jgi:hypothetical protein
MALGIKEKQKKNTHIIVVSKQLSYNHDNTSEFKIIFNKAIDENKIVKCAFADDTWFVQSNYRVKLIFPYTENKEINNALKCYAISILCIANNNPYCVKGKLNAIISAINLTNNFNIDYLGEFDNYSEEISDTSSFRSFKVAIKQFLEFYEPQNFQKYLETINNSSNTYSKTRTIATYASAIEFDYLLQDYILNYANERERKQYYPIYVWWRLTKILPLRPIELLKTRKDCLIEENEKYYFRPYRSTLKGRKSDGENRVIPILDKIRIDKELYDLLIDYSKNYTNYIEGDKYFISYNALYESSELSEGPKQNNFKLKIEKDFVTLTTLSRKLNKFYKDIIGGFYKYNIIEKDSIPINEMTYNMIERITLGDTRHYAFTSLMLQGFDVLSIAQLGGHTNLFSQQAYVGHLDKLVKGHVYTLSKKIKSDIHRKEMIVENYFNPRAEYKFQKLIADKQRSKGRKPKKTEYGLCWNDWNAQNPFKNCNNIECIYCNYHVIGLDEFGKIKEKEILQKQKEKAEKELESKIKMLKMLICNTKQFDSQQNIIDKSIEHVTVSNAIKDCVVKTAVAAAYNEKYNLEIDKHEY